MGLFSGVGQIIGGIKGSNDQAENPFDFFSTRKVFQGGFRAGGRSASFVNRGGNRVLELDRGKEGQIPINALKRSLRQLGPGFKRLTKARVKALDRGRTRAVGNLREQFGARNITGSSFALQAEAGVEAEFSAQEAEARAQSFVEQLQLRTEIAQTLIQTQLTELGLANNVQARVADLAGRIALARAGLESQAAADRGAAFQSIFSGIDTVGEELVQKKQTEQAFNSFIGGGGGAVFGGGV